MGRPRKVRMMVAREACVVTVGARPIQYERRTVINKRTGEPKEIDIHELPLVDEGDPGISYTFKMFQKVRSDHPAVLDAPGCFMPLEEVDEVDQDLVNA